MFTIVNSLPLKQIQTNHKNIVTNSVFRNIWVPGFLLGIMNPLGEYREISSNDWE